jgi:hypothetical protein
MLDAEGVQVWIGHIVGDGVSQVLEPTLGCRTKRAVSRLLLHLCLDTRGEEHSARLKGRKDRVLRVQVDAGVPRHLE